MHQSGTHVTDAIIASFSGIHTAITVILKERESTERLFKGSKTNPHQVSLNFHCMKRGNFVENKDSVFG